MAQKIKGITIEIGGDTQPLNRALEDVNKKSRDLQGELRQVERLLKLDPSNTELVAQKQKLLAEAVENSREKLNRLKAAQEQVNEQFKSGEISEEQYRSFQREVIKAEQDLKKLEKQLRETNSTAEKLGKTLKDAGKKMTDVGKDLSMKVTAPILGIAAASQVVWEEVDSALDAIATNTGATGEELEKFHKSFKKVYGSIPTDAEAAGNAIGEINTQFALTGEALEETTNMFIKFAQINSQDVTTSVQGAKGAMEAFELTAEDLGSVLDAVTRTAQNTGVSTDKLFDTVTKGAPQLKALGLDFAQATELMGRFEQKGIDSSKALSYLSRAQVQFAKDGKTMSEGLEDLAAQIQSASSETEALNLATEVFGTRGATFMLDAIKRGALDFEDFAGAADRAAGAVDDTFEAILDPADQMTVALNNLKLVGADLGQAIQETLAPMIEKLVEWLQRAAKWFESLSPEMKKTIVIVGGLVAAIGPLLIIVGQMASGVGTLIGLFGGASAATGGLTAAIGALTGPIGIAIAAIVAITTVIMHLWKTNEDFREGVKKVWENIKEVFRVALEVITTIFQTALGVIRGLLDVFIGLFTGDWKRMSEGFKTIWSSMWNGIKSILGGAWNLLSGAFSSLGNSISGWFRNLAKSAIDWGKNIIQGLIDGIKSMVSRVKDAIGSVVSTVTGGISKALRISSPSKVMEELGRNTAEGFALGIKSAINEVEKQTQAMTAMATPSSGSGTKVSESPQHISYAGMFSGANFYVRSDNDIRKIAEEIYNLTQSKKRSLGVVTT